MTETPRGSSVADFMTPSRSDVSLDGVHSNTEDTILRREFESYKLKTRDWQNKVRERDAKMRAQLQTATDLVQAKDAELDACLKRVSTLDETLRTLRALQGRHDGLQSQVEQLTQENATLTAAVRSATASQEELEGELQRRVGEVKELRGRLSTLEDQLEAAEFAATGLHRLLVGGRRGGRLRPDVKVLHRIDVGLATYCYAVPADDPVESGAWIRQEQLPQDHGLTLPDTISQWMEQQSAKAVHAATLAFEATQQAEREAFEQRLATAEAAAEQRAASLSAALEAEHRAREADMEHALEALRRELADAKAAETRLRLEELPSALVACRKECEASSQALVQQLQGDIETLQAYKSKAQVAMRNAAQHAAGAEDKDKLRKVLESEYRERLEAALSAQEGAMTERHAAEIEALERNAEQKASESVAVLQAELSSCRSLIATHEATIAAAQQAALCASKDAAAPPRAPTPSAAATAAAACQTDGGAWPPIVDAAVPTQPPPMASIGVAAPLQHEATTRHGGSAGLTTHDPPPAAAAGGSMFSFESMLNTLGAATPRESAEVARLHQQLRQQQQLIQRHREELRDVALREKSILEQDALLKEQIRELERAALRTKDVTEGLDYMKNVVMKVLTCREPSIRRHLMPVISEVLHLSPAERADLMSTCTDAS